MAKNIQDWEAQNWSHGGEREKSSPFSSLSEAQREVQNSLHGSLPRGALSNPLSINKKSSRR